MGWKFLLVRSIIPKAHVNLKKQSKFITVSQLTCKILISFEIMQQYHLAVKINIGGSCWTKSQISVTSMQKLPPEVSCKKSRSYKNFAILTGKTPVPESLFNKVAGLTSSNFIKKRLQQRCFPVNIAKIFQEHLFWKKSTNGCFWQCFQLPYQL